MRGILIVAIVLGHSRLLSEQWPWLFGFVYKWHVHGFFFLAMAARGLRAVSPRAVDILVRFMVPFCLFVTVATALNALRGEFSASAYILALGVGSARLVNAACDMSLFWFLPAFAGFLLVTGWVGQLLSRSPVPKLSLGIFALACVLVCLVLPRDVALYVPFGLPIVAYVIPGAIVFCLLNEQLERLSRRQIAMAAGFLVALFAWSYGIVGDAHLDISLFKFGQNSLLTFIAGMIVSISAALFLKAFCLASRLSNAAILARLGESSLVIFLVHSFVQAPLVAIAKGLLPSPSASISVIAGLAIATVALAAGLCIDSFVRRRPTLRALVLPPDRITFVEALRRFRGDPLIIVRRV